MTPAALGVSLQQSLANAAVIAAALTAVVTMVAKVPPFKQIGKFFLHRLIVDPIQEWFHGELHDGVCPIIKESVAEAVPEAVAAAVKDTVEPAVATVRRELREHMNGEEQNRVDLATALIEQRRLADERDDATTSKLSSIDERLGRVETKINEPVPALVGSVELHPAPPEPVEESTNA